MPLKILEWIKEYMSTYYLLWVVSMVCLSHITAWVFHYTWRIQYINFFLPFLPRSTLSLSLKSVEYSYYSILMIFWVMKNGLDKSHLFRKSIYTEHKLSKFKLLDFGDHCTIKAYLLMLRFMKMWRWVVVYKTLIIPPLK